MAVAGTQNVVTFKQKPVIIIRDKEILDLFKDENLVYVLKFLKKAPMTIGDLVDTFQKIGEEKSDKSVYRYLHKLIKAKLVAKAGKRITSKTSASLTSETIYTRSAIAFITVIPVEDRETKDEEINPVWDATRLLLSEHFGKNAAEKAFTKFANKLDEEKDQLVIDLFENASEETLEKVAQLDYAGVNFLLQFVAWLAIIPQRDIAKDLKELFDK
ncbi:MAG: hypothetical protein KGD59_11215 [Candidatus Heimdallarchaeota archaeon]|nr:hypothetical protein [Candidatus Heimdallarchaeota archaeon]MBY8995111.1 hypothetical protein [Candidatus Heimdallarchaeota archaeon]